MQSWGGSMLVPPPLSLGFHAAARILNNLGQVKHLRIQVGICWNSLATAEQYVEAIGGVGPCPSSIIARHIKQDDSSLCCTVSIKATLHVAVRIA